MESNDRMHFQNDKEIEKLIPFEQGELFPPAFEPFLTNNNIEPILYSEKI
jgi:hypothetical protein